MADEFDPKVSQRYRDLGAEEPPRALDEAILAASRRPARSWTQRWAVPLSLAAVLVLSVTVTLRIQHEQPGIEAPEARPAPAAGPKQATTSKEKEAVPAKTAERQPRIKVEQARKPATREEPAPIQRSTRDQAPAAPAPAAAAAPAPAESMELRRDAARAPQSKPVQTLSKTMVDAPAQELERIAQLRQEGRHDEADKALAEFRKRYPDYRIPAEMLERVEKR